jgi:hypothetical protein
MVAGIGESKRLAARLHDVAAGLSIGIGFARESDGRGSSLDSLPILETALADLKQLTAELDRRATGSVDLVDELECEAARLEIELKLRIDGEVAWLSPNHLELLFLFCREGLRNSRRHSGGNACGIDIELARCPWVVRVRDWGAGIQPGREEGNGLALARRICCPIGVDVARHIASGHRNRAGLDWAAVRPRQGWCEFRRRQKTAEDADKALTAGHLAIDRCRLKK